MNEREQSTDAHAAIAERCARAVRNARDALAAYDRALAVLTRDATNTRRGAR